MAAVTVEQTDIRGLDIDKTVKGFALINYIFKGDCTIANTKADSIRWYQEEAEDLTTTDPSTLLHSPLSTPTYLEPEWTRNTSYILEYMVEAKISEMDLQSADIDVLTRTLLRLTRAVVKKVDTKIWDVVTEDRSPVNINMVETSGAWDTGAAADPFKDILFSQEHLISGGYSIAGTKLYMGQVAYRNLMDWILWTKGSSVPQFSSEMAKNGVVMSLLGIPIVVSPNCTADFAVLANLKQACTWKSFTGTTSAVIRDPGLGNKIRVWEAGIPILTDPKAVVLISNTTT